MRHFIAIGCFALAGGLVHGQERELLPIPAPENLPPNGPPRLPPTVEVIPGLGVLVNPKRQTDTAAVDRIVRTIRALQGGPAKCALGGIQSCLIGFPVPAGAITQILNELEYRLFTPGTFGEGSSFGPGGRG